MRLTLPQADCNRTKRTVGHPGHLWFAGWVVPLIILASGSGLSASAPASAPRPTPRRGTTTVAQSNTERHPPALAVVYDGS